MPRTTYVLRDGRLVEKHLAPHQSGVFHVIRDGMDALAHPCTGEMMDSKSAFRRVTKAHGCEEVGNETQKPATRTYDERSLERDIVNAIRNPDPRSAMSYREYRQMCGD